MPESPSLGLPMFEIVLFTTQRSKVARSLVLKFSPFASPQLQSPTWWTTLFATTAVTWPFAAVKRSPVSLSPTRGDVSVFPAIVTVPSCAPTRRPFPLAEMSLFRIAIGPNDAVPYETENPSSLLNPVFSRTVFPEMTVLCFPEEYRTCTVAWRNVIPRIDTPRNPSVTEKLRRAGGRPVRPILGLKPFAASRFSAFYQR